MSDEQKDEKKEYIAVLPESFLPEFEGERIDRAFRIEPRLESVVFGLPVPKTDKDAQKYYGCDLGTLIEKGVKQVSYDKDTGIRKMIKENPEATADQLGALFATDLATIPSKKERKQGAKRQQAIGSQVEQLAASRGLTTEEVIEMLKGMPAKA